MNLERKIVKNGLDHLSFLVCEKPLEAYNSFKQIIKDLTFESFERFLDSLVLLSLDGDKEKKNVLTFLTLLFDLSYPYGNKKRSFILELVERKIIDTLSYSSPNHEIYFVLNDKSELEYLRTHRDSKEYVLVVDALQFPQDGKNSLARFVVEAYEKGWKNFILYNLRGHRFVGSGLENSEGVRIDIYGDSGDYLASGLNGAEIFLHGSAQDQVANLMRSGKLVIFGDVGQAFMYGSKGGKVFVLGNAAGRPLINAVADVRVVINGTCLDYLAESLMGGTVILNGIRLEEDKIYELNTPYPGNNLFSLASGGVIYIRDPYKKVDEAQLNSGKLTELSEQDWSNMLPLLKENEKYFNISIKDLLKVGNEIRRPEEIYRKVEPVKPKALT